MALVGNLLAGPALDWFAPICESRDGVVHNVEASIHVLRERFDDPRRRTNAALRLYNLSQGRRSVSAYASEAHLLVADSGWDDAAAEFAFQRGFDDEVRHLL